MSLKKIAASGAMWAYLERFGVQMISVAVSLFMARILEPSEFGLIGMLTIFMAIAQTLVDSGLTQSLIREKDPSQVDYSTVFFFNIVGSLIIYGIVYLCSPLLAAFYNQPLLQDVTRAYCLVFVINSFSAVQVTKLSKEMNFKAQLIASLPALALSSICGILFAINGFGVWALVYMALIRSFLNTVQLWFISKWRPTFMFDIKRFKYHFSFGYKLGVSGIISAVFANIYPVIIGKFFSPASLGFYDRANTLRNLPLTQLVSTLNKVTYPLFANINDDDIRLKRVYKQIMQMVIFFIAPVMLLMAALAEPMILLLLSEKWRSSIEYLPILCLGGILSPFHVYNLNILKVKGRSDLFLRLEIIKRVILVITLFVSVPFGIVGVIWGQVIDSVIFLFINSYYSGRMISYPLIEQLKDIAPYILMSLAAALAAYTLQLFMVERTTLLLRFFIPGIMGMGFYFGIARLFDVAALRNLINLIKNK